MKAVTEGAVAATINSPGLNNIQSCLVCGKNALLNKCGNCLSGRYCSVRCQKEHPNHQKYCSVISELQNLEERKSLGKFLVRNESKW